MGKLRLISISFILLMTVQLVPVASIGVLISSNQWNEELPHIITETGKVGFMINTFLIPASFQTNSGMIAANALSYLHMSDKIPANHSNDVLSPPPDVIHF